MKNRSTKPLTPFANEVGDMSQGPLKGRLGVMALIMVVVAGAAPLGVIASGMPIMLIFTETFLLPVYYVIAGAILILFAVGYVAISKFVPRAAAFYTYIQAGLGRVPGLAAALLTVGSYLAMLAGIHVYAGLLISDFLSSYFSIQVAWWICSLVQIAVIGVIGYMNINLGVKVLYVLVAAEVAFILVMNVFTIVQGGAAGLDAKPFDATLLNGSTLGVGVMFAAIAFFGFEAITVFRGESKNPERTIPRATYGALAGVAIFYVFTSWAVVMGLGSETAIMAALEAPELVIINLAATFVGAVFADLIQLLIITSLFASALAFHNVIARAQFNLGNIGILPRAIGKRHPTLAAPSRSSVIVSLVSFVLILVAMVLPFDPYLEFYVWMVGAGGLGLVGVMAMTAVAIVVFFAKRANTGKMWNGRVAPILASIGLIVVFALVIINFPLLVSSTVAAFVIGFTLLGIFVGGIVYGFVIKAKRPHVYDRLAEEIINTNWSVEESDRG